MLLAFHGDPTVKAAILACAGELDAEQGLLGALAPDADELAAFSARSGLDPSLLHLLRGLVSGIGDAEDRVAFVRDALASVPLGSDTRALVRRWYRWLWDGAEASLIEQLAGTPAAAMGDAIISLQDRTASGTAPTDRHAWRKARADLRSVSGLDVRQQNALDLLSGFTWDVASTPGAAEDLSKVIENNALRSADYKLGWSARDNEVMQRINDIMVEHYPAARERAGEMPSQDDRPAFEAYLAKIDAILLVELTEEQREVFARSRQRGERMGEVVRSAKAEYLAQFRKFLEVLAERV